MLGDLNFLRTSTSNTYKVPNQLIINRQKIRYNKIKILINTILIQSYNMNYQAEKF